MSNPLGSSLTVPQQMQGILYEALTAPVGVLVQCADVQATIVALKAAKSQDKEAFANLTIRATEAFSDGNLLVIKTAPRAPKPVLVNNPEEAGV
jgi:hypothetical protein